MSNESKVLELADAVRRPLLIDGDIAQIQLTRGFTAIIDAKDVHLVDGFNWQAMVCPRTVYACRTDRTSGKPKSVLLHRVIMGEPDGLDVDHVSGNGLDNRRLNLRLATKTQNNHNQRIRKDNTSGYKGVYLDAKSGKWRARVKIDGKQHNLGYHNTPEEAHAARCKAANELHGKFVNHGEYA